MNTKVCLLKIPVFLKIRYNLSLSGRLDNLQNSLIKEKVPRFFTFALSI